MSKSRREHANNLILALFNLLTLVLAIFLVEYVVAQVSHPEIPWPPAPIETVLAAAGIVGLGSMMVLAILALLYKKGLSNRSYLWWMTGFNLIVGVAVIGLIARSTGWWNLINFVLFP